jgi:hypothetical protein
MQKRQEERNNSLYLFERSYICGNAIGREYGAPLRLEAWNFWKILIVRRTQKLF